MSALSPLTADNLTTPHGFFTREGGVSHGILSGLNCGYGSNDERDKVTENRRRVAAYFHQEEPELLTLYQIHSDICIPVSAPFQDTPPEADSLATATPGLVLGILTADCAPVLFCDTQAKVIGAAHAGWKGAHGGVIESTLTAMEQLGASRQHIAAAIGPCIAQKSYEVGPEFVEQLIQECADNKAYFTPPARSGKSHFNLRAYVKSRLEQAGIQAISVSTHDTLAEEEKFYSYRRATLRGEPAYGRQISCITLEQ